MGQSGGDSASPAPTGTNWSARAASFAAAGDMLATGGELAGVTAGLLVTPSPTRFAAVATGAAAGVSLFAGGLFIYVGAAGPEAVFGTNGGK